jgi:transcriptional repressor NrdR
MTPLSVIKKDGRREDFDREKIMSGVRKACQKRPISLEAVEAMVDKIEKHFQDSGEKEVSAVTVGEMVVRELYDLDDVAYVRFASVYRNFRDANEFMNEIKDFLKDKKSG